MTGVDLAHTLELGTLMLEQSWDATGRKMRVTDFSLEAADVWTRRILLGARGPWEPPFDSLCEAEDLGWTNEHSFPVTTLPLS